MESQLILELKLTFVFTAPVAVDIVEILLKITIVCKEHKYCLQRKLYAQTVCLSIQQTPILKLIKSLYVSLKSQFTCFCKSNINQILPTAVV